MNRMFFNMMILVMILIIFIIMFFMDKKLKAIESQVYCQCSPCECKTCNCTKDMPYPNFDKSIYDNKIIEY